MSDATTRTPARPGLGIALIVLMAMCFAWMDNSIRYLGQSLPVLLILWARYGVQAASMGLWLGTRRRAAGAPSPFRTAHPRFQALRGALLLATSALSFYGVQHMPVAEFTAIVMLTPVGVTLLAGWLLDERVSRARWALVVGCFVGALIVIRPGSGIFGNAVVFPLACALTYACFQVLTSKLAALENPYTTHFYTGLFGTLLLTLVLAAGPLDGPAGLASAAPWQWAMLLAIGALGTLGHLCLILALGMAPATTLMPFIYVQIGMAAAVGWAIFRTLPDGWGWVGMAVIAACGAATAWMNVRSASTRRAVSPVAADALAD